MAVQVRLDLSSPVSVRDLRTFLNCLPQYTDETKELRYRYEQEDKISYLIMEFPSASRQSQAAQKSVAA
ncbi:hypothetical protein [Arthrobacter sp. MAHUQ-56]